MSGDHATLPLTPTQTVGPFFHFGLADDASLADMAPDGTPGERITLRFTVLDADGVPVPDALVELYQADADGRYATHLTPDGGFSGFGRLPTREDGTCEFHTIRPGRVVDPVHGAQAAHVNVCLLARGLLSHLFTRVYFEDDDRLATDPLLGIVPEARRQTLVARRDPEAPSTWTFSIHLQGPAETVFFLR